MDVRNPDATVSATSYTITGLTPASEYSIWIKATNDGGMAKGTNLVVSTDAATGTADAADMRRPRGSRVLRIAGHAGIAVDLGDKVSLFSLDGTRIVSSTIGSADEARIGSLRPGAYVLRHGRTDGSVSVHGLLVE